MEKREDRRDIKWFDNSNVITSLMIGVILLIIVCSQSFAVRGEYSLALFGSIINHNSVYLLVIIYFVLLKTHFGKKYFNYLNLVLIFIYSITMATSLLTVVQAFSLNTVLTFFTNVVMVIYLFHTMFRDTRVWKEFSLGNSPFNELSNEWYFYALVILSLILLTVNLVSTVVVGGVIISILDTLYIVLFSRYVYLYRDFLDKHKIDSNNKGNFTEVKENIKEACSDVLESIDEFSNEIEIKVDEVKDKAVDMVQHVKEKSENITVEDAKDVDDSQKKKKKGNTETKGEKK